MRIDRRVTCCAGQVLVVSIFDVISALGVSVPLGQSEIDDIDDVLLAADADQKVVRLDVSMNKVSRVHELYPLQELFSQHQHRFQGELALAVVKQIFERGTQ